MLALRYVWIFFDNYKQNNKRGGEDLSKESSALLVLKYKKYTELTLSGFKIWKFLSKPPKQVSVSAFRVFNPCLLESS